MPAASHELETSSITLAVFQMQAHCFGVFSTTESDLPSSGLYGVHCQVKVDFPLLSFPQISKAEKGCKGGGSPTGFQLHLL